MAAAALPGVAAAAVVGVAVGVLWLVVLPRLPEPVSAEGKRPYATLATARLPWSWPSWRPPGVGLAWLRLPVAQQPVWVVLSTVGDSLAAVDELTMWTPAAATRRGWLAMAAAAALMVPWVRRGQKWAGRSRAGWRPAACTGWCGC